MPDYLVTWEIDITADSSLAAAKEALVIMQDKYSEALNFTVTNQSTREESEVNMEPYFVSKPLIKLQPELHLFEELSNVMRDNYTSNFHVDNIPWQTRQVLCELCELIEKRMRG